MKSESGLGKSRWAAPLISLALFLLGLAFLRIYYTRPPEPYDEGLVLEGAWRVALGQIPYRDFWTIYSPGQFYIVALFFKLFGTTVESERWWDLICRAALPALGYLIATRATPKSYALLVWVFLLGWAASILYLGYPLYPALDLCLLSLLMATMFISRRSKRWLFGAGIAIGLAILFRMDFGLYAILALLATLAVFEYRKGMRREFIRNGLWIVVGALVIVLPVAIYFMSQVPLAVLSDDLIWFPLTVFPKVRGLPVPPFQFPETAFIYLPFLALLGGIALGMLVWKRRPEAKLYAFTLFGAGIMGILLANQARVRTDIVHAAPYIALSVILFGVVATFIPRLGDTVDKALVAARFGSAFILLAMSWQPFTNALQNAGRISSSAKPSQLERAPSVTIGPEILNVVRFIQSNTSPGEYIFVGDVEHDKIFWNEPLIYFLADRPCPTKYDELHPGSATTALVQREIVDDLKSHDVRWVVLLIDDHNEPNESSMSSGVHILDTYLHRNFEVVTSGQRHLICRRK